MQRQLTKIALVKVMIHSWFTVNKYWLGTWKAAWSRKKIHSRSSKGCVYLGAMRKGWDIRSQVKAFRFYLNIVKNVKFLSKVKSAFSHWAEMNRLEVGKEQGDHLGCCHHSDEKIMVLTTVVTKMQRLCHMLQHGTLC